MLCRLPSVYRDPPTTLAALHDGRLLPSNIVLPAHGVPTCYRHPARSPGTTYGLVSVQLHVTRIYLTSTRAQNIYSNSMMQDMFPAL